MWNKIAAASMLSVLFLLSVESKADRGPSIEISPDTQNILDVRIMDAPLSDRAKMAALKYLVDLPASQDVRICNVVALDPRVFFYISTIENEEIEKFLRHRGLRVGLSSFEIDYYRSNGSLPQPSLEADVYVLNLGQKTNLVLYFNGIGTLSDLLKLSLKRLKGIDGIGSKRISQIVKAMRTAGYTMPVLDESQDRPAVRADGRLSENTKLLLKSANIKNIDDLERSNLKALEAIPGIDRRHISEIAQHLSTRGRTLYKTAVDRSLRTGEALDLDLPIYQAAHIEIRLIRLLEAQNISKLADLLDQGKMKTALPFIPNGQRRDLRSSLREILNAINSAGISKKDEYCENSLAQIAYFVSML